MSTTARTLTVGFEGQNADLLRKVRDVQKAMQDVKRSFDDAGKGVPEQTKKAESAMERLQRKGESLKNLGSGLSSFGGKLSKWVTAPVVGAVGTLATLTAALGWKRLVGLDTAKAQFEGLGFDVKKVMEQVDKGVTDTSLSMAEGASAAVSILSTGNIPMKDLEKQIKRVANVAAAYNIDAEQANYLLNLSLVKNKVTYGDLSQMQKNGIPILSELQKKYKVTGEELMKMAKKGEISLADLNAVLDDKAGAAAESYAKSWKGVNANIKANLGRLGAEVLGPAFEIAKTEAAGLLKQLKSPVFKEWAKTAGKAIGDGLKEIIEKARRLKDAWGKLTPEQKKFVVALGAIAVGIGPTLVGVGKFLFFVGNLMVAAPKVLAALKLVGAGFKIVAGFLMANPIGIAIGLAVAAISGLVYWLTKTESGQKAWAKGMEKVKAAAAAVVEWWHNTAVPALAGAWDAIKAGAAAVVGWWQGTAMPALTAGWDAVKKAAAVLVGWMQKHLFPVFEAFGGLVVAMWQTWIRPTIDLIVSGFTWLWQHGIKPALDWIAETWAVTWANVVKVWGVIGKPLLTILATQWDSFKILIGTVWKVIKNSIETTLGVIKNVLKAATAIIKGDWAGAWKYIKEAFSTAWSGTKRGIEIALTGIKDWIARVWRGIRDTAAALWGNVRDKIMGVVDPLVSKVKRGFESMRDGIGKALNGIKAAAARPINFVIGTVWNNGLRRALNLIPGVNLGEAKLITGYRKGGHTGWGGRGEIAGAVHGREYVLNARETERMGGPTGVESWKRIALGRGYRDGGFVKPVNAGSSGWNGGRYRSGGWHGGLDFPAGIGAGVYAAMAGRVSKLARLSTSYGHHVMLDHGGGVQTLYAHMSSILTSLGAQLKRGQQLGRVGSTGNSTGPHLHFEVRRGGRQVDPTPYLRGGSAPAGASGSASGTAEDPGIVAAIMELPGKIRAITAGIKRELTGPWGGIAASGAHSAVKSAETWALGKLGIKKWRTGVRYAPKHPAWVGEGGPELLFPRGGEQIVPHSQSVDLAAAIAGRANASGGVDLDELVDRLIKALLAREAPSVEVTLSEGEIRRIVQSELRLKKV